MPPKNPIKSLYYITHIDNIPSMIQHGILSHGSMESRKIDCTPIYDTGIVSNRKEKTTPSGTSLWEYANLYFQPRNPMMYRVIHEKTASELAVVAINPKVLEMPDIYLTDGNAAHGNSLFYPVQEGLRVLKKQQKFLDAEYWNDWDGSKRKIMAECLIPQAIAPNFIHSVFIGTIKNRDKLEQQLLRHQIPVIVEPRMFFRPNFAQKIGKNISLLRGDMFFSEMQTLTVSVNLEGVMGKGLASRAKYQFPDVYVAYQDMCRSKRITESKPGLYKRESSLDEELADQTEIPLKTPNADKWFMLFATKRRWRENSRLDDIEAGLSWFTKNFEKEKITSVAFPALGCGLGGLSWSVVGPLMCRHLHDIGIRVGIYLPQESDTPPEHLTETFLMQF